MDDNVIESNVETSDIVSEDTDSGNGGFRARMLNLINSNRQAFWSILALIGILLVNRLIAPDFFSIEIVEGRFYGSLVDILNRGAPVMLLALGMTLVIASRGVDLSVGAVIAISGATAAVLVSTTTISPIIIIFIAILAGVVCGIWNGILVAIFDMQPIVATLILMVSGRGIAQMITQGQIAIFNDETLSFIGTGVVAGIQFPIILTLVVFIAIWVLVRRTALGLMIESVGANDRASYYTGINAAMIKLFVYAVSGFCAALAGLILTADIKGADANNAGLLLELDAILAAVLGGASLNGGRFYLGLSLIGALIIQSIETGILFTGLPATFNLIVKATVILIVLLMQSDIFRQTIRNFLFRKKS